MTGLKKTSKSIPFDKTSIPTMFVNFLSLCFSVAIPLYIYAFIWRESYSVETDKAAIFQLTVTADKTGF